MRYLGREIQSFCVLAASLLLSGSSLIAQETVIGTGHFDLGINYEKPSGWRAYIHDYGEGSHREPFNTIYSIGSSTETVVPEDSAYALLGNSGDKIWIIPEIYSPNTVFLGIGAPLLERNIFSGGLSNRGQLSMRLVSVEGTGPDAGGTVSLWQSGFPPRFYFSSADGIDEKDALTNITANFHAHYNWGFTKPGLYRVTFELSGTLVPELGGQFTSTQVTYSFEIINAGNSYPLRYAWALGSGWAWSSWMGFVYTENEPWYYADNTGWLYMPESTPDSFWAWSPERGWLWSGHAIYPFAWKADNGEWISL